MLNMLIINIDMEIIFSLVQIRIRVYLPKKPKISLLE